MKAVRVRLAPSHPQVRGRRARLAATVLVVALALTGCARNPDEAVRVGDVSISNEQVDATSAPLLAHLQRSDRTDLVGELRQSIVEMEAVREVARRYALEQGVDPLAPDYAGTAATLGMDADDPYVRLNAETRAYVDALAAVAQPRTPTDEEMRPIYDQLVAVFGEASGVTFEQVRAELLGIPEYAQWIGLSDGLRDAADRYGLVINPRYQPAEYPLFTLPTATGQGTIVLVWLPLGEQGTGAASPAD